MKVIIGTSIVPTTVFIILLITFGIFLTLFPQFIYAQTVEDKIIENTLEMVENATGEEENTLQETTENSKPTSSLEITEPFQLEKITTNLSNDNESAITTEDSIQTTGEAIEQANNEAVEDQTVGVNETSSTIEQLKPVSDEMLEYSAEKFGINLSLPRETNVQILNRIFKDPEVGLQSFKNLEDAIDSLDDDPYGNQYENSSTLEEQLKLAQEKLNQIGLGAFNTSKLEIDLGFPPVDFSNMLENAGSLVSVEYQSAQSVVLRGDEENLLLLNGTLAPFWYAIDIVKKHGYQLKEITESGMGSQGNPTRFYAILEKEKISTSAKESNENLSAEELLDETIALENETINETIKGHQEEQIGGSTILKEQLKLVQGKINQSNSFSDSGSQSLDKQAQSVQEEIKNQTYQVEDTGKAEETENWIIGESDKLSFKYPSHWNVDVSDSRFDNYELLFMDKASNTSIQVSDEAIKPIDKVYMENGPEEYVDMYMKYNLPLSSDASRIDTYPKGKISIAGLPAYSELYLDQENAILISLAFPEGNDRHYTVFSSSPASNYDKIEPTMLEIIKSINPKTIQKSSDQEIEIPSH